MLFDNENHEYDLNKLIKNQSFKKFSAEVVDQKKIIKKKQKFDKMMKKKFTNKLKKRALKKKYEYIDFDKISQFTFSSLTERSKLSSFNDNFELFDNKVEKNNDFDDKIFENNDIDHEKNIENKNNNDQSDNNEAVNDASKSEHSITEKKMKLKIEIFIRRQLQLFSTRKFSKTIKFSRNSTSNETTEFSFFRSKLRKKKSVRIQNNKIKKNENR